MLVNSASLADVNQRLSAKDKQPCADVSRFRPNLLVEGAPAFAEDAWASVSIGSAVFQNAGEVCMHESQLQQHLGAFMEDQAESQCKYGPGMWLARVMFP